jgi:hypothetical protein
LRHPAPKGSERRALLRDYSWSGIVEENRPKKLSLLQECKKRILSSKVGESNLTIDISQELHSNIILFVIWSYRVAFRHQDSILS